MEGPSLRLQVGAQALSQGNFQTCWCCGSCHCVFLELKMMFCDGLLEEGMKVWLSGEVGESWLEVVGRIT